MRVVFNIVAVVCLAVGLGGILWSGDWRLLLSFPVALALGLAAVVACRQCLGLVWWESLLPLILSAGVPGYIRTRWPRRDLPFAVEVTPPLLDYKKEKRDRRERKRERQLSALRRSQRRG